MLVFPSEALISDLIVAERAYAADRWGQPLTYDSAEKPSWSKNLEFWGNQITLPISQKPLHGHFRASFFCHRTMIFYNVGKSGVFQQNRLMTLGAALAWLSFPHWKQHGLVGTRSRAIRRRMSKKGANSKQEKLMARASAPKEQERVAEAAKRSVETCSAGRAGAHPYRRRRSGSVLSFLRCIPTIQL